MKLIFWIIGILIAISIINEFFSAFTENNKNINQNNDSDANENNLEPKFYTNSIDAMSDGAMFKIDGDDDGGPGFYI